MAAPVGSGRRSGWPRSSPSINVLVTVVFRASVEAQSGAYATGVLVLILSAALAVTLALWREGRRPASAYFGAMTLVFAYTLVDNCLERPDGVIIGSAFISSCSW